MAGLWLVSSGHSPGTAGLGDFIQVGQGISTTIREFLPKIRENYELSHAN